MLVGCSCYCHPLPLWLFLPLSSTWQLIAAVSKNGHFSWSSLCSCWCSYFLQLLVMPQHQNPSSSSTETTNKLFCLISLCCNVVSRFKRVVKQKQHLVCYQLIDVVIIIISFSLSSCGFFEGFICVFLFSLVHRLLCSENYRWEVWATFKADQPLKKVDTIPLFVVLMVYE